MGRPMWQIKVITAFWPVRNFLASMVGWPVIGRSLRSVFRGDRAHYIPVRVDVERPESLILPSEVVEHLIRQSSFRFILNQCLCRSLEPCQRYPEQVGCLFLGGGAKEINPALGRGASAEEALAHHRHALGLGLIPVIGKVRGDSLWLGVKRADQLLTVCHCCDCCCYFKIYRFLPREVARSLRKLSGLEVRVDEACDGCGVCVDRCFIKAMRIQDGRAVAGENCRGCGRCSAVCPKRAVQVFLPAGKSWEEYFREIYPLREI